MEQTKRDLITDIVAVIGVAVLILTFIFGDNISQRPMKDPIFTINYGGFGSTNGATYEVAEELSNPDSKVSIFDIIVSAKYNGDEYSGPMYVRILPKEGSPIVVGQWDDFRVTNSEARIVKITSAKLFEYSGLQKRLPGTNPVKDNLNSLTSNFKIEISYNNTQKLHEETVTVVFVPWYHSTQLSDFTIREGEDVNAYVVVTNNGIPGKYNVVGNLYDSTTIDPSTINIGAEGWYPAKTWKNSILKINSLSENTISTNDSYMTTLIIPSKSLLAGHTYILETFAIKYLPYLDFSPNDWISSDESWRPRDQPQYLTIIVLNP